MDWEVVNVDSYSLAKEFVYVYCGSSPVSELTLTLISYFSFRKVQNF